MHTQKSAFEMDEKARRDENEKSTGEILYKVVVGKGRDGQEDEHKREGK